LKTLKEEYGPQLRLIFRHNPLITLHNLSFLAAEAAEAAGAQGGTQAFWVYHDLLFERQNVWAVQTEEEAINSFVAYAGEIGLDEGLFEDDLRNGTYQEKIFQAYEFARNNDLNYVPALYMNGYEYPLQSFGLDQEGIAAFLALVPLLDNPLPPPPEVIDPSGSYTATVITEKGDIAIKLFPDTAPVNVNSFVYLARHNWYDETTFHRVISDFVAQGGDPSGTGIGWPGYYCDDEIHPDRAFDQAGVVAFVNNGPNTNGGQFFITHRPIPQLNFSFTIIGQVISGQDVVESLTPRDPTTQPDFIGDKIIDIQIAGVIEKIFLPFVAK
jgi:cyclophilin family peptidyl-prolyl cis-trans isomerase